jgi:hypothetical protein
MIRKRAGLIGLMIIFISKVNSQNITIEENDLLFLKNHWTFLVTPHLVQKAKINHIYGNTLLKPRHSPSFNLGIIHTINFNQRFGLDIGVLWGTIPNNIKFELTEKEHQVPYDYIHTDLDLLVRYISFPFILKYRKSINKNTFHTISLGCNLRHITWNKFYTIVGIDSTRFIQNYLITKNNTRFLNFNLGTGILFTLKNKNFLRLNLVSNLSFTNQLSGEYKFINVPVESGGTNKLRMSYIGTEVGYTLTKTKKSRKKLKIE